ncbi:MAG: pantoate--beta-alanine ligase [Caulobacteraceae bacterium]|nr:pantoate--beta-alanine ligase [Caulobacteraceae bacterium]
MRDPGLLPVARDETELRRRLAAWRSAGDTIALVPTMGALHEGHLSLVRLAGTRAARVVASLFVNPTQFGPGEDFAAYPKDEAADAAMLRDAGCDLLYAPTPVAMYPPGFATTISVAGVSGPLEGERRPGHFAGVATVVTKLLLQAGPDVAVFGEKDYQQLQVIRRLAADLDLPTGILAAPIVRAPDGLALSSRNAYLNCAQRRIAPALKRALDGAAEAIGGGAALAEAEAEGRQALLAAGFDAVDYFETRDAASLERPAGGSLAGEGRLLAAARLGTTRLLDNIAVSRRR